MMTFKSNLPFFLRSRHILRISLGLDDDFWIILVVTNYYDIQTLTIKSAFLWDISEALAKIAHVYYSPRGCEVLDPNAILRSTRHTLPLFPRNTCKTSTDRISKLDRSETQTRASHCAITAGGHS